MTIIHLANTSLLYKNGCAYLPGSQGKETCAQNIPLAAGGIKIALTRKWLCDIILPETWQIRDISSLFIRLVVNVITLCGQPYEGLAKAYDVPIVLLYKL